MDRRITGDPKHALQQEDISLHVVNHKNLSVQNVSLGRWRQFAFLLSVFIRGHCLFAAPRTPAPIPAYP